MIKQIDISALEVGMYIHDLGCSWTEHPFFDNSFAVDSERILSQVKQAGITALFIDTDKGRDAAPVAATSQAKTARTGSHPQPRVPATQEFEQSRKVYSQACGVIKNLMHDVRLGKQVQRGDLEPMTNALVEAAFRNHYAFTGISRLKTKDEYTFMHSVSVAGLLVAYGNDLGMSEDELHQLAMGGLLHDIGKSLIPDEILNKPGKLTVEEFEVMKRHVEFGGDILDGIQWVSPIGFEVAMLHHEKIDGSGYPKGLKNDEISTVGKMASIVDVYDALTSERVYKTAWQPTTTLKSMMEWSPKNLSRGLVEQFVRCLGIYPVGSTVKLQSGLIGVIIDQNEDLLRPQVRIVYDSKQDRQLASRDIDLTREHEADRVLSIVEPGRYGINTGALLQPSPA